MRYRPDIDGLRAVAIGAVLVYHLKLTLGDDVLLSGGFLGVDVFFVISGYLITSIILSDQAKPGGFSYADFYERRARRLLPPLLIVLIATAIVSYFLLVPSAMVELASSALASIFFVSNFFWQLVSHQYGATSVQYQPLLHTWSLAVEEQFYLIYPTILLLALKYVPKHLPVLLLMVIVLGLFAAETLTRARFGISFYWPISRIWELLAGALVALRAARGSIAVAGFARLLPDIGLVLIAGSMMTLSLSDHHPGLGTVPAVLGTTFILAYGNDQSFATRLLSTRPMVWIGLISYSLYLWHYPVYAFGRMLRPDLIWLDYLAWMALSVALAWISWRFIERPFRDKQMMNLRQVVWTLSGTVALVSVFALSMIATDGMRGRLTSLIALYGENEFDNEALTEESWSVLADLAAERGMEPSHWRSASRFEQDELWFEQQSQSVRVLIVGDSHSKDMFNVLTETAKSHDHNFQTARYALPLRRAEGLADAVFNAPNFQSADIVVLSYRYRDDMFPHLRFLIEAINARGKPIVLMSASTEFNEPAGQTLFDVALRKAGAMQIDAKNAWAWTERRNRTVPVNAELAKIAAEYDLTYYEKDDYICDDTAKSCTIVTPDGRKVFYDYGHYTLEGAAYFGKRIADLGWFSDSALAEIMAQSN